MHCLMSNFVTFLKGQVVSCHRLQVRAKQPQAAGEDKADEVIKVLCLHSDGNVTELCTTTYVHTYTNTSNRNLVRSMVVLMS